MGRIAGTPNKITPKLREELQEQLKMLLYSILPTNRISQPFYLSLGLLQVFGLMLRYH